MAQNLAHDEEFLGLLPSKWWVNFFKKFGQIDELPPSEWKQVHQLAHFSNRYRDHYSKRFSFTLKGRPSACTEIHHINRMVGVLGTSNQLTIKEYIDWVFDNKIIPSGRKIRSIGYLANAQFCNEFHLQHIESKRINRATSLPHDYQEIVDELGLPIRTYGDLAFVKQAIDLNPTGKEAYEHMFNKLYSIGFEYEMVEGLK